MIAYFAQAIDEADQEHTAEADWLYRELCDRLFDQGHAVYSPARAWHLNPYTTPDPHLVEKVNAAALGSAGVLVVAVYPGMRSVGVWTEVGAAIARGTRVHLVDIDRDGSYQPGLVIRAAASTGELVHHSNALKFLDVEVASWKL